MILPSGSSDSKNFAVCKYPPRGRLYQDSHLRRRVSTELDFNVRPLVQRREVAGRPPRGPPTNLLDGLRGIYGLASRIVSKTTGHVRFNGVSSRRTFNFVPVGS